MDARTEQHLIDLETELLGSEARSNPERLDRLLSDQFVEFGSSGRIFDKPAIMAELRNEPVSSGTARTGRNFSVRTLSKDTALVTYVAMRRTGDNIAESLRSSIWQREGSGWALLFHQGTLMLADE